MNSSQWYLTFKPTPHLDKKHTVFGKLVGGEDVLDALEAQPVKPGTERLAKPVRITEVVMYVLASRPTLVVDIYCTLSFQDPFEEYKTRQEKKRAKKAEAEQNARHGQTIEKKDDDELNWFGVKLGAEKAAGVAGGGGVGKYLQVGAATSAPKRPAPAATTGEIPDESKKKRKVGFGDFAGW
jgi:peptidyl-prolyl cis-trans isomerase-like 2